MTVRAPWRSPSSGDWSWTTLWLNLACLVAVLRFAVGAGISVGTVSWNPGELDPMLVGAMLTTIGGLYWGRRGQEGTTSPAVPTDG